MTLQPRLSQRRPLTGLLSSLFFKNTVFFRTCIVLLFLVIPQMSPAALVPLRVHGGTGLILLVEEYCTSRYHWKEIARINKLKPPYQLAEGQEILVPEELLKVERLAGKIDNIHGGVFFLEGDGSLQPVTAGDQFWPGQTLVTQADGFAHVIFPDQRFVRVASDTQFSLTYLVRMVDDNLRAEFSLKKGKIIHSVKTRLDTNESYRTRTPVAITGVRGTEFRIKVAETGESAVETLHGVVAVDGQGGSQAVRSGEGTRIMLEGVPLPPQPLPETPPQPEVAQIYKKLPVTISTVPVKNAEKQRFRVTTDLLGNATILEKTVDNGRDLTLLALPDAHYYGFLTAIGPDGLEGRPAPVVSFQVRTIPGPPIFTAPYRGKSGFGTSREIVWMKDENAASYHVQIASDKSFQKILIDEIQDETKYLAENLAPGDYFVRVEAIAADEFRSLYSLTDSWTLRKQPSLGTLASGSSEDGGLSFSWESMGAGITYDVQVGTSNRFSTLIGSAEGLVESEYSIDKELEAGKYFVRIRGVLDDGQKSPWSPPQVLKIEQPPFSWKDGGVLMLFLGAALL